MSAARAIVLGMLALLAVVAAMPIVGGQALAQEGTPPLGSQAEAVRTVTFVVAQEENGGDSEGVVVEGTRCRRAPRVGRRGWRCSFQRATAPSPDGAFVHARGKLWLRGSKLYWSFHLSVVCQGDDCDLPGPKQSPVAWKGSVEAF